MKRIGVLTGGGDCPGLNAVLVGIVNKALAYNWEVLGILKGWKGVLENLTMPLDRDSVSGILPRGGTILKTSRTNPCKNEEDMNKAISVHGMKPVIDETFEFSDARAAYHRMRSAKHFGKLVISVG